jgi:Ca-activated chloride channel family protein
MGKITFLNPEFFWLFLLIPISIAWMYWKRNEQTATLKMSSTKGFKGSNSLVVRLKPILNVLRILALSSLIIAIAFSHDLNFAAKYVK